MRYAFIDGHRTQHATRVLCKILNVHSSGFYRWVKSPLNTRVVQDARQTALIKDAWKESGKIYGYRKLHDELIEMGGQVSANRVARLARLPGIQARIGYKKPGNMAESRL